MHTWTVEIGLEFATGHAHHLQTEFVRGTGPQCVKGKQITCDCDRKQRRPNWKRRKPPSRRIKSPQNSKLASTEERIGMLSYDQALSVMPQCQSLLGSFAR